MKNPDIINAYKKYQASRIPDSEDEIMRIVALANKKSATTKITNNDEKENHVAELFKSYQQQRDPHRKKITETVMAAARQNIQRRKNTGSATIFSFGKTIFSTPQRIIIALRDKLVETKSTLSWQAAAPALALVAVVAVLVPQMTEKNQTGQSYATNGISAELLKHAPQLVTTIQHASPMTEFGFSAAIDPSTAAFQLGFMTTDLYMVSATDNSDTYSKITAKIQRIISQSETGDIQLPSLENKKAEVIARDLEQYFNGHEQETIFRFGKWLEASLFAATAAINGTNSQPLQDLMMQWQMDGKNTPLDISTPIARLVADLDKITATAKPELDEIRKFRKQLLQIKAALQ